MPTQQEVNDLIAHNDELENYFRNTIIPQLFVDANLVLRKFTPPAMKQFNLAMSDQGRSMTEIHDNFRFPNIMENIQSVIDSNEILEKEIQTSDFRWYQMNIIPYIRQKDNKADGVIITFVEITARIKDLKELESLISEHETLLDTLSHDIKNPLSNMLLAIEQVKTMDLADEASFTNLLGIVERSLTKMRDLITDLSDTREAEHKYEAHVELLNIEHILEDVRITLTEDLRSSNAIITSKIEASEITFSRRKLRSIIYNLLHNSIKYGHAGKAPEITISTAKEGAFICISVQDNGIGIAPDQQETVFSKYYRVDNSIEGSGIGLYLVKEMVTQSGGHLQLESTPGRGTTIRIFLKA